MTSVTLHVVALDVDAEELSRCLPLLDEREHLRAAAFRFHPDRRRFIVRRARLRMLLGAHIGLAPERLAFTTGAHGKPGMSAGEAHFSTSQSGDLMMLAIADAQVGCDIERIDAALDWRPIADRFFSPTDRAALYATPEGAARRAFFDCWTRKEALVKAIGLGVSYPLDTFEVSVGRASAVDASIAGWAVRDAPPQAGYSGAVAVAGSSISVSYDPYQEFMELRGAGGDRTPTRR